MAESPMVSIVIPVKNRAGLIRETLDSFLCQTYPHFELLVVDDGSTDGTQAAVRQVIGSDPRVHLIQREAEPGGAPVARNIGMRTARGKYLIFFDSDDLAEPTCLEGRVKMMEANPDLDFAVFDMELFRERPGDLRLFLNCDTGEDDLDRFLRIDTPWGTPGPIWTAAALRNIGVWDEGLRCGQDMDLHCRALVAGFKYTRGYVRDCHYRRGDENAEQITGDFWAREKVPSHLKRFAKLTALLAGVGQLSERRRALLAGNYFFMAQTLCERRNRGLALEAWNECRLQRLIGYRDYVLGAMYFVGYRFGPAGMALRSMRKRWLAEMFEVCRSRTLVHTPTEKIGVRTEPVGPWPWTPPPRHREVYDEGMARYFVRRMVPGPVLRLLRKLISGQERGACNVDNVQVQTGTSHQEKEG